jgi:leader peptidase (prepilin peptidase)/N-methyltransferase
MTIPLTVNILAFIFGACIGSFLNVCIYRIPAALSIVHPGSSCPRCKTMIPFYDNIPILSYLLLRGKCRNCRVPIAIRYPLVELLGGLLPWPAPSPSARRCMAGGFRLHRDPDRGDLY